MYMLACILPKLKSTGELKRTSAFKIMEMDFLSLYRLRNHPKQQGYFEIFFFKPTFDEIRSHLKSQMAKYSEELPYATESNGAVIRQRGNRSQQSWESTVL